MDDIIKHISEHAGLDMEKSKHALEAVLSFLRTKLPAPIVAQIESQLHSTGHKVGAEILGEAAKKLGGLFGAK